MVKRELKIDLGCGSRKREGFKGVDCIKFKGVDKVCDLTKKWPFKNASVDEAHSSHFVEHLTPQQRCHFLNELYRVLKSGAKCTLIAPHWDSCRAYGDPTHQWPPIGEFWFYYMSRDWRRDNAPHTDAENLSWGLNCDFEVTWGYSLNPTIASRNSEFQQFAINHYREAIWDVQATLTKK